MRLTNDSNYPVTVNGVRIETGRTEEIEIEDVERYRNDRRFSLEEDDEPESDDDGESEDNRETSKSVEQNTETGD